MEFRLNVRKLLAKKEGVMGAVDSAAADKLFASLDDDGSGELDVGATEPRARCPTPGARRAQRTPQTQGAACSAHPTHITASWVLVGATNR